MMPVRITKTAVKVGMPPTASEMPKATGAVVDFGANGEWEATNSDNVEAELSFNNAGNPPIEGNQWVGLDIPLSDFTGLTSRESLAQLIISGGGAGDVVWLDNIYLYNNAVI